jgi:hypothetical protein
MKINTIKLILVIAISLLIAYGLYSFHHADKKELLATGSFILLSITGFFAVALKLKLPRTTALIRTVASVFFGLVLISAIIFCSIQFSIPVYIITNGLLFLVFLLTIYSLNIAKQ